MADYSFTTRLIGAILGVSVTAATSVAFAHHGFQSRYDTGKPLWIEGTVERSYFGNPHSEITVRINADLVVPQPAPTLGPASSFLSNEALHVPEDLPGNTVELELPPTAQYSSLGNRVAVGDRIAAVAIRNCEAPYQLNVQWLRLADGSIESRQAAMRYMVEQC